MRSKLFVIPVLLLLTVAALAIVPSVRASDGVFGLSATEMMLAGFTKQWGPGTLTAKTPLGVWVQFDFTGLSYTSSTGVGVNLPVIAGGGVHEDYGYGFAGPYDFSGFGSYRMYVVNRGPREVRVCLKMNTGWTNDWSGGKWKGRDGFGASPERDTLWQSAWVGIPPGEHRILTLDFSNATVYGAMDDPVSAWRVADGTSGVTVRRTDEAGRIGFQILGYDKASIIMSSEPIVGFVVPELPLGTIAAVLLPLGTLTLYKRKRP